LPVESDLPDDRNYWPYVDLSLDGAPRQRMMVPMSLA
jgi:hypothetical protein